MGNCKKKKKKSLYTKDVDLLTKKSEYQSDNTRVPFSCFKMKALCGCWTAGSTVPTHCDTATSSAEWKSWGTTANSVPAWMCCNNCLFSHTTHEGGENLFSKKDAIFDHLFSLQHLGSCMSWSIVYSSSGDILFACSAEKKKKNPMLEQSQQWRILKTCLFIRCWVQVVESSRQADGDSELQIQSGKSCDFLCESCAWSNLGLETDWSHHEQYLLSHRSSCTWTCKPWLCSVLSLKLQSQHQQLKLFGDLTVLMTILCIWQQLYSSTFIGCWRK